MSAYPLENRELIAEAPGLRMQILTLAAGQEVPWHWHSEVTDTFWCMDGPMVIETRAPREVRWGIGAGPDACRPGPRRAHRVTGKAGGGAALRHPAGCRDLRVPAGGLTPTGPPGMAAAGMARLSARSRRSP